jgi:predicted HTH domain antitoxin
MKKEQMVGARLPQELVRGLELIEGVEQSDRSTTLRRLLSQAIRDWKLEHYARLYGDRKVSLARAAQDAGVSLWEMMDYVRTRRIAGQYDLEDFERDLGTVYGRLGR